MRSRLLLLVLALLITAGCGSGSGSSSGSSSAPSGGKLVVFAASSLIDAFPKIATTYQQQHPGWNVEFEFLGSDQLAALLGKTTNFATNTLVLATPADNPAGISSVNDIGNAKLVVGDPSVPIGAYTLTVLDNLGIKPSSLNIVSQEAKVTDIVTKLELGEADAGFIYTSDAKTAGDKLKTFQLPASAQATATYPIGIVTGSKNAKAAQQWIDLVMSTEGQQVLVSDGFGPAPSS